MVKLSKEAKQRLQQLFKGGQFAIRWGFIPLVIYLAYFGDKGLFGHRDVEASMDRNSREGVRSDWDKRCAIIRQLSGTGLFSDASVAEWNSY